VRYDKSCYKTYAKTLTRFKRKRARSSTRVLSPDVLTAAFDELLVEIGEKFNTSSYKLMSFLAKRLAELTCVDVTVENRDIKNLLVEKYGEDIVSTYSSDQSKFPHGIDN